MTESYFSSPETEGDTQILSSEKLEEVIQELTSLRGATEEEFDSDSIDNAVRFCEKMDICFENLNAEQKSLLVQNYEFFSSSTQMALFIKLMFHGDLSTKEITTRALAKKLKATAEVIQCIMSTQGLFESPEIAEEVGHTLMAFVDTLCSSYANLVPPSIRDQTENSLSVDWLQRIFTQETPIFDDSEVPYSEVARQYADLLYAIFSHEKLTFYLKWKDLYLRYWLVEILRAEDQNNQTSIPVLSTKKADLYVEYKGWTKISKRLNASLRHRPTFDNDPIIRAEQALLERLPSNILLELVFKLRKLMKTNETVPEVDLGVEESSLDESALYNEMIDEIIEADEAQGKKSTWLHKLVAQVRQTFSPKEEKTDISFDFIERKYSEGLLPTTKTDCMRFGVEFPQDYLSEIPQLYSQFLTHSQMAYDVAFEESVLEILMVYEDHDMACIENTPYVHTLSDVDRQFDFDEHCLALPIGEEHLLLLGNTYFAMSFQDYNNHPSPYAYFKWFQRTQLPQEGKEFCRVGEQYYRKIPMTQIKTEPEFFEGMIQVIDSLSDESREKPPLQQFLHFLVNAGPQSRESI